MGGFISSYEVSIYEVFFEFLKQNINIFEGFVRNEWLFVRKINLWIDQGSIGFYGWYPMKRIFYL